MAQSSPESLSGARVGNLADSGVLPVSPAPTATESPPEVNLSDEPADRLEVQEAQPQPEALESITPDFEQSDRASRVESPTFSSDGNGNFSQVPEERADLSVDPAASSVGRTDLSEALRVVTEYFQQRWQATDGNEPLMYEVQLDPAGTIVAINPLNIPALQYRWDLPETPVVSPLDRDERLVLRVVLYPDGQVQVIGD